MIFVDCDSLSVKNWNGSICHLFQKCIVKRFDFICHDDDNIANESDARTLLQLNSVVRSMKNKYIKIGNIFDTFLLLYHLVAFTVSFTNHFQQYMSRCQFHCCFCCGISSRAKSIVPLTSFGILAPAIPFIW